MTPQQEKRYTLCYSILSTLLFIIVALRCWLVPFAHDEVATFFFYIQAGDFLPFTSHPDANGHFLTSALGWLSFKMFGSSPFALRLPSLFAFMVLSYAVYRITTLMRTLNARLVFISVILLSFNFINFYSLCRGYGISMSFLLLSLFYFFAYLRDQKLKVLVLYMLFSQVALAANLTLIFVLAVMGGFMILRQLRQKTFLQVKNILLWLIFFGGLLFWIKYAFFLKEAGALYYGGGESYWQVTFQSLIETVLFRHKVVDIFVLLIFGLLCVYSLIVCFKTRSYEALSMPFILSLVTLITLIIVFYLLKIVVGVNYPEDRTGLFFYLLFTLAIAFAVDGLNPKMQLVFIAIPLFYIFHFISNFNLRVHSWRIYETMPVSFYDTLQKEQQKQSQRITIGGHRVREFIYGFINYNSPVKLNHMTSPEALQMNCDYALAYDVDAPYYREYYTELAREDRWGFRLLKRTTPLTRTSVITGKVDDLSSDAEYHNFFEVRDTSLPSQDPLLLEVDLEAGDVPIPFNAWLVLQADATDAADNVFVRVPLNLVRYDWRNHREKLAVVTGNIPSGITRLVAYLWNINKSPINIKVHSATLYQLHGEGVTQISKAKI